MDISTNYLGMKLSSPLMPGSSPLTDSIDNIRKLVDAGAGAIVLHSLYEEQITFDMIGHLFYGQMYTNTSAEAHAAYPHPSSFSWSPEEYLQHVSAAKKAVKVPVIASLNCTSHGRWEDYLGYLQSAGADALELNIYFIQTNPSEPSQVVEDRVVDIVNSVRQRITLPLAVKLSPFFTSLPWLARRLQKAGVDGLVLFNRFHQPDIDVIARKLIPVRTLSAPADGAELRLRLRAIALLSAQTRMSLALTGGAHTALDVIKGVMAGAHVVQMVSSLLLNGPAHCETVLRDLRTWMESAHVESLSQIHACLNLKSADPSAVERGTYLSAVSGWDPDTDAPNPNPHPQ